MRKITKDSNNPPAILIGKDCKKQLKRIITTKQGKKATYYHKKTVIDALNVLYKNKCGYCESRINVVATENVEHYRPKAGVDEIDLVANTTHKGYYWLSNEWSNLLIACPKCNQQGHKGNRFPITVPSNRVNSHPVLLPKGLINIAANLYNSAHIAGEIPLLLHPEHTEPENYFVLKRNGELDSKKGSIYADNTIDICKLNRQPLSIKRQKIIDEIIEDINKQILEWNNILAPLTEAQFRRQLDLIFTKIIARLNDDREYTFVARMIIRHFNKIILLEIEPRFRPTIKNQFNTFLNSN
jgi:5-methylcytosine-specific restriction endonuclease McrA